ncbi:glycoside hydrolase family 2 protein [Truncatella angustata]|uniref:Glycoside hydrolase family 2 protein n=1 Tax=Truncatella angustata TaxID=152316 RepID=A0A9P8ZSV2_9PEZI|nr:glycoside hydrolase family 2 protein [Truncatella angustata]KAH6648590.1 glycoside hydrolase family 2 protein [Truncatella angustata]
MSQTQYPRPDFTRPNLNWKLLNGKSWSLLFDDQDIGLSEGWHINGPPDRVTLSGKGSSDNTAEDAHRLEAFPELKEKYWKESAEATENVKKPINVPFAFQCPASGWGDNAAHEVLWYETLLPDLRSQAETNAGHRVLVRFGAVDYEAQVWVGGQYVGGHRGGHVPFDVDVTDALEGKETKLVLRVRDSPSDLEQPRGKQYWAPTPESIFYTPTSGIWQNVWVEVVPRARIGGSSDGTVLTANDTENGVLKANVAVLGRRAGGKYGIEIEGSIGGVSIGTSKVDLAKDKDYAKLELSLKLSAEKLKGLPSTDNVQAWRDGLALWSPDYPLLYDLKIRLYDSAGKVLDEIETYTGVRNIDWKRGDGTFRLNGEPLFQILNLDQGYWPETGLTPPSSESLKLDVELAKKMGFNGCRKHQKVEDPIFLYWADKLGYLVWGEIANAYEFSAEYVKRFDQEWTEAVKRDINHPSLIVWTPVNESWAYPNLRDDVDQRNHIKSLYWLTKSLDPTRPINDNCGWEHVQTDLSTYHDYNDAPELSKRCATADTRFKEELHGGRHMFVQRIDGDAGTDHQKGAPIICSEFGGVNIAPASESEKGERDWGYTTASDPADLLKRIDALCTAVVQGGFTSGFVWTQLTEIEQEVNGLYSFDRREKIDPAEVKKLFDKAAKVYLDAVAKR